MSELKVQTMGLRPHFDFWQTSRFKIPLTRPLVMGILNATPDSFSQASSDFSPSKTIEWAEHLLSDGADILDLGGESTRPGAIALSAEQEWIRVQPVLEEILKWNIPISLDTYHPENMRKGLDLGVDIINDVHALRIDGALNAVASSECGICLMHMHGEPLSMQKFPMADPVIPQVLSFFNQRLQVMNEAGILNDRIVIDPGIGFGKTVEQNFQLLGMQQQLSTLQLPVLSGWSRKSSLGAVTGLPVEDRMLPSVVAALISVQNGASIIRVHDVAQTRNALKVWDATKAHIDKLIQ
jgi:dihydropteroate synthase